MEHIPKPEWLKIKVQSGPMKHQVEKVIGSLSLHTVCEAAACPNRMECFNRQTATFLILGRFCTRNCRFCNVQSNSPEPVDSEEPLRVAQAVLDLGLKHVVVTSVTRDDLSDGGAGHFAAVIRQVRQLNPYVSIEVLIPDFQGDIAALQKVIHAKPEIINHNMETVPRLYDMIRSQSSYARSLELLNHVKTAKPEVMTKSGIMLGFGETKPEIISVFQDLRAVKCDFLTIGQYLAPSSQHQPVFEYVHPDVFREYRETALKLGFRNVESGPLVRSSYRAAEFL